MAIWAKRVILNNVQTDYELGQIMTRYDILNARLVIVSNVRTNSNLAFFTFGQNCHVNWGRYQLPASSSYRLDE